MMLFFLGCLWPAADLTKNKVDHLLHVALPGLFPSFQHKRCLILWAVIFFFCAHGCVFKLAHLFQWVVRTFVGVCVYIVFRKKTTRQV